MEGELERKSENLVETCEEEKTPGGGRSNPGKKGKRKFGLTTEEAKGGKRDHSF